MSISSEITRISGNVSDALTAISNKGVTVPSGSNSDDLADLIGQISGGGGTTWETKFNGTIAVTNSKSNYYYGTSNPWNVDILQNSVWRVTWNNVEYQCVATYQDSDLLNYAIGNPAIVGGASSGNNEPFLLGRGWNNSTNTWDYSSANTGYLVANGTAYTGGVYDSFVYGDIGSVNQGDVLNFYFLYNDEWVAPLTVQYVVCYDSNGNAVEASGAANVYTFTVPSGISRVSITMQSAQNQTAMALTNNSGDPESYIPYLGGTDYLIVKASTSQTVSLKIEQQVGGGGSTLITKTITANGTYDAEDDDADGYSQVTVSLPTGTAGTPTATKGSVSNHSISVTPSAGIQSSSHGLIGLGVPR